MLKKDIIVQISPEHLFMAFSKQLKTGASLPLTHSILSPEAVSSSQGTLLGAEVACEALPELMLIGALV